jgi:hypothetical protein
MTPDQVHAWLPTADPALAQVLDYQQHHCQGRGAVITATQQRSST